MSSSLNIFRIVTIDKTKLTENLTIPSQQTFSDLGLYDEIGSPKSYLKKIKETGDLISFKVKHYSETKKAPVRIYWDTTEEGSPLGSRGSKEISGGYQEIYDFYLLFNLKENEVYVFASKEVSVGVQKRLKKSGIATLEPLNIDLSKLDDCVKANNIWGIWEDGVGRCKKKAMFGPEVNKEEQHEKSKTTTYNLQYNYNEEDIDLIVSSTGGISSRSREIGNDELLEIYNEIKQLQ